MENDLTRKKEKKISTKVNFLFSLFVQIASYLITLLTSPYLSRVLGPSSIGENAFINSTSRYFVLIISFGFLTYGVKEISRLQKDKKEYSKVFWNIVSSRAFLFVICFLVYFLLSYFWGFGTSFDKRLFLIYSLMLLSTLFDISYLFQGLENFKIVSLVTVFYKIAGATLYFLLVKSSSDLIVYVLITCLETCLSALTMWLFAIKRISRPVGADIHLFQTLKSNLPYFLPTIAMSIYTLLDKTMLGYLSSSAELGYYEQAYKIIVFAAVVINSIGPVILSRISSLIEEGNEDEVRHKIIQMAEVSELIIWPSIFGLYAIGDCFIPSFFGEEYMASVKVLYWLTPLIFVIPLSNQIGNAYYLPRGKVSMTTYFLLIGASINLLTNFFAIKYLGAEGAAITSLAAEAVIAFLYVFFSRQKMPYKDMAQAGLKPFLAGGIMFGVLFPIKIFALNPYIDSAITKTIIGFFIGVIVYCLLLLIFHEPMVMSSLQNIKGRVVRKKDN